MTIPVTETAKPVRAAAAGESHELQYDNAIAGTGARQDPAGSTGLPGDRAVRSKIYRLEADLRFSKRVKIGTRAVGWLDGEVRAWVIGRIESSRARSSQAR